MTDRHRIGAERQPPRAEIMVRIVDAKQNHRMQCVVHPTTLPNVVYICELGGAHINRGDV